MSSAAQILLQAEALGCERNGRMLFGLIDLALRPGDVVWLRGGNGSGKTTLIRALAGLHRPATGSVARSAPLKYVGHASGLKASLTVEEGLQLAARLEGAQPESVARALSHFGLGGLKRRRSLQLSQGQRRRAALAPLALGQQGNAVWLLDEPFDALDEEGVHALVSLTAEHRARGGALIFTSHQAVPALQAGLSLRELALA